ncbi:hypothetical protein [uncultured Winogradskyella sp.]|uniref:hypothetical protein n=1 Tax=Winogradskyella sp. 4-2091 TaxID=3381659 RepID=UPI0026346701|nr:hypothetical protein [uncultured Winogradskyella sp.]
MKCIVTLVIGMFLISCGLDEPYFMSVKITNCDIVVINESFMELSAQALQSEIYRKTKGLDSLQLSKFFVKLSISPNTPMEKVSLVKSELQKANILKIRFYEIENVICGGL